MQKVLFASAVLACSFISVTPVFSADSLTQGERDFAMSSLHASRKLFLDSVAGLSKAQWNFKPAPDRWSIAECAEHLALSEDYLISTIKNKILTSPAVPEKRPSPEEARAKDQKVESTLADRSHKYQAPQPIRPDHKFASPEEAVEHFRHARDANIRWVETTTADLRDHVAPYPSLGNLDAYQWLLVMSGHTIRHTEQIKEIKANPNFPRH